MAKTFAEWYPAAQVWHSEAAARYRRQLAEERQAARLESALGITYAEALALVRAAA